MSPDGLSEISHTELVSRIIQSDPVAINEFYGRFIRGLQYFLRRQGIKDSDVEDLAHDTIFTVVRQIQKGALANPECLAGYVRTVAMRQVFNKRAEAGRLTALQQASLPRFSPQPILNPEQQIIASEKSALIRQALTHLRPLEAEILTRFYLQSQDIRKSQAELGLTETQFRLQKCRAKARLAKEVQRMTASSRPPIRPAEELAAA